jgi:transcriptional regulator
MYLRAAHAELDLPTLYKFIRSNPLGVLTTAIKSPDHPLLQSSHIPWVLDLPSSFEESTLENGEVRLRGHLARANPHAKALIEAASGNDAEIKTLQEEVMVLFTSPITHYVTPKFYVETKPSTGKVVPTWNYAAVQAYGTATIYYSSADPETGTYLTKQINDLSRLAEEDLMGFDGQEGRKGAWTVNEAPESYVGLLKKAIIGMEITVTRLQGKWKMSQELGEGDREGTIQGFEGLGTEEAGKMAALIKERGELKEGGKKS